MDPHIKHYKSLRRVRRTCTLFVDVIDGSATVGASVRIKGTLSESRGKQDVELHAKEVTVLGESPETPQVLSSITFVTLGLPYTV